MRTRSQLLLTFLSLQLALTLVVAVIAWNLLHANMRGQAEEAAKGVAQVLTGGGFSLTDTVLERMRELTGYDFELVEPGGDALPGTIRVAAGEHDVQVLFQTESYDQTVRAVFVGVFAIGLIGMLVFAVATWIISASFARPVEHLALAARRIGDGELDAVVPAVGHGEVAALASDLESMRARLRDLQDRTRQAERLATLGTFTATIAHEVRNPLSAVRLTVQMLQQQDPANKSLQMIDQEIERLDCIVDELLGFSRGMNCVFSSVALEKVVSDVVRLLSRQAEHAGVELQFSGSAHVSADPQRLKQLLLNLVMNAIQAQYEHGGSVHISIEGDGFRVADAGPGVPEHLRADLFEPFTSDKQHGTGLGLHLARLVAEAHGAVLCYQFDAERGSVFQLSGLRSWCDHAKVAH